MRQSSIAINSISTKQQSVEEALAAYSAAGFKQVEFFIPPLKDWIKQGHSVRDAKAMLDKYGLRCVGGFQTRAVVFGSDAERRDNHALLIENAQLFDELSGGKKTVIVVGTDGPKENSLEALVAIGKALRELVEKFPSSVSLALEFNWSPIVRSIRSAYLAVEAANHPRVGILFDPAHYHCTASKFEDLTKKVVKKIIHVHVDDMRDKPGEHSNSNSDRVLPGEGIINLKKLLGHLEKQGYRGVYSLEMFNEDLWKMPAAEAAKLCYRAMKRLCV